MQLNESVTKALVRKWDKILNYPKYAPIKSNMVKENLAVVLENTANVLNETVYSYQAGKTGGQMGDDFPKLAIPLLRRIMPGLIANEIVGVQPMTSPVGLAFALRYQYAGASNKLVTSGGRTQWDTNQSLEAIHWVNKDYMQSARDPNMPMTGFGFGGGGLGSSGSELWLCGGAQGIPFVGELALGIDQMQISAGNRKLRTSFSLELAQDIKALHNIDIDDELTNMLTYEIQAEIEQEIITKLILVAAKGSTSTGNINLIAPMALSATMSASYDSNEQYAFRAIWTKILDASNEIASATRRGPATFVFCSPKVLTALQTAGNFIMTPVPNDIDFVNVAAKKVGYINNGRTAVYLDLFSSLSPISDAMVCGAYNTSAVGAEYALVGYKGGSELDCGVFYCPYVPILTLRAQDPTTFAPKLGVMSRYAITDSLLGSDRYYRLLRFNFGGTTLG